VTGGLQGLIKGVGDLFKINPSGTAGGDAEAQEGGFYGGINPPNPFADLSDQQIQELIDAGVTPGTYVAPNFEE